MEFDCMLARRFGIHNLNRCPEGVSSRDEYRIRTLGVDPEELMLDVPAHERDGAGFHRIGQFGSDVVLARSMNYSDSLSEARVDLLR